MAGREFCMIRVKAQMYYEMVHTISRNDQGRRDSDMCA